MGFWSFDDKTQIAMILAGLVGCGGLTSGCGQVADPAPPDARGEKRPDARLDFNIVDPAPIDLRADTRHDASTQDIGKKQDLGEKQDIGKKQDIWIPAPDAAVKKDGGKKKDFWIVDPAPMDASAARPAPPAPRQRSGRTLPLDRELRARIRSRGVAGQLELSAETTSTSTVLSYRWQVSGGSLDRKEGRTVRWTPPTAKGRYLVQLTVREGSRAVSIDVLVRDVK
jgi:hypothetical protein